MRALFVQVCVGICRHADDFCTRIRSRLLASVAGHKPNHLALPP